APLRPGRLRGPLSARSLRRHAAAGRPRADAARRPPSLAPGRALRRPRRPHPHRPAPLGRGALGRAPADPAARDPRPRRGADARRPGARERTPSGSRARRSGGRPPPSGTATHRREPRLRGAEGAPVGGARRRRSAGVTTGRPVARHWPAAARRPRLPAGSALARRLPLLALPLVGLALWQGAVW